MDNVAPNVRSRVMASVRSRGNRSTEMALRFRLVRAGIRGWRLHAKDLPGCPDFAFDSSNVAVYVDGCFWHGCKVCARSPKSNIDFWQAKVGRNIRRDNRNRRAIRRKGWRALRIWEHEFKQPRKVMGRIVRALKAI